MLIQQECTASSMECGDFVTAVACRGAAAHADAHAGGSAASQSGDEVTALHTVCARRAVGGSSATSKLFRIERLCQPSLVLTDCLVGQLGEETR